MMKYFVKFIVILAIGWSGSTFAQQWVPVGGYVYFGSTPLCALVLINGQSEFSCDGTGRYDMDVPLDSNGNVTVQVFAAGFEPLKEEMTPQESFEYQVNMKRVERGRLFQVNATSEPSETPGWFYISGRVEVAGEPLCTLVLANGQKMFSCDNSLGVFYLKVPADSEGNVTLQVFAAGFEPYIKTSEADPDTDNDGIKDRLDDDDDNDGLDDFSDACPLESPNSDGFGCPSRGTKITEEEIVVAAGREWAQPYLFLDASIEAVSSLCPRGPCDDGAVVSGRDMTGWTWASVDDLNALFNSYGISPALGPGPSYLSGTILDPGLAVIQNFWSSGWWLTEYVSGDYPTQIVSGYTRTKSDFDETPVYSAGVSQGLKFPSLGISVWTSSSQYGGDGIWFFRER